jgi:hypothetical protein
VFPQFYFETNSNMDIRSNITPIIVKGLISKDVMYFNIYDPITGNPFELPSRDGVIGIRYIGGGAVGRLNNERNGFIIDNRNYRNGIIRKLRNDKNINLLIRTFIENGVPVLFSISITQYN